MVTTLQAGFKFSRLWPSNEPYLLMFEQTKQIKLVNLLLTVTPAIAMLILWLQLEYLGIESLNTALAMSLLVLSIPLHGYFLLGKKAEEPLPLGLKSWYHEIEQKIKQQEMLASESYRPAPSKVKKGKLTYMDLAVLLKALFTRK
ncbi:MAG: DUF412 family protein [Gammaproteobacteria bacterium]|nr:DUF412 family protein [Gammaproteobacteria bacterium]